MIDSPIYKMAKKEKRKRRGEVTVFALPVRHIGERVCSNITSNYGLLNAALT